MLITSRTRGGWDYGLRDSIFFPLLASLRGINYFILTFELEKGQWLEIFAFLCTEVIRIWPTTKSGSIVKLVMRKTQNMEGIDIIHLVLPVTP
jgi:hypothetical protein